MPQSPSQSFRRALETKPLVTAMAAHDALGARLVEEAGFDAVWASGFELSASSGVPDASIVTMSEHLEVSRRMAETVPTPVIADLDTGHGNAVNVHYAVRRYVAAGAAAVVMEDKVFPKDTSLRPGGRQHLLPADEFQGKIAAALDAREASGLVVIARTEALIAGGGQDEAIRRAEAYREAGADLILVHSRSRTPDEIEAFAARWTGRIPLAVVPTAYPAFTEARAAATGKIGLLIYGNHGLRAAVKAMRDLFARIRTDGGVHRLDAELPSVADILALQGDDHMRAIERRFLT